MAGGWRRLLQRIAGSSSPYPEYKEYRDKDDYDAGWGEEERPPEGAGGQVDELSGKLARLKLAAGFVLVLSLGASVYLYYVKPSSPEAPVHLREAATTEALRRTALGEEGAKREESLDDIKRWANDMTRRTERDFTDTYGSARNGPQYYGQGSGVPGVNAPLTPPVVPVVPASWETGAYAWSDAPSRSTSGGASEVEAPSGPAYTPPPTTTTSRVSPQYEPPPTAPPPTAPSYSSSRDTSDRPYQPRRYEPVVIEPRVVEPY